MACTSVRGLQKQYLAQLAAASIDAHVEEVPFIPCLTGWNPGGAHGWAVDLHRTWAHRFSSYRKLIFTDAWDVLFYGSKQDVLRKIPDDDVLLGADRVSYPDLDMDVPGQTPWRFVNGGSVAGTPASILKWLDGIEQHPQFNWADANQRVYNIWRRDGSPLVPIDDHTELFYCLFGEKEELDFDQHGLPVNTVLGTHPNFLHANGSSHRAGAMARQKLEVRTF